MGGGIFQINRFSELDKSHNKEEELTVWEATHRLIQALLTLWA